MPFFNLNKLMNLIIPEMISTDVDIKANSSIILDKNKNI